MSADRPSSKNSWLHAAPEYSSNSRTSFVKCLGGWRGCLLFLLAFSICFQNIVLFNVGSAAIKPYHLATLVFLIVSFADRGFEWCLPPKLFTLVFILFIAISLINTILYNLNIVLFNYIFFFIEIVAAYNLGSSLTQEVWVRIIQTSAFAFLLALFVNISMNLSAVLTFASHPFGGHPSIPSLFGGGVNLDSSWLALFGVFFQRDLKGNIYMFGSLSISLLYASRVGVILCVLSIIYVYVIQPHDFSALKRIVVLALTAIAVGMAMASLGGIVVDRFLSIGDEPGSVGRLDMWQYAFRTFLNSPIIGHGAGNAISAIEAYSGEPFSEGNIHNYYLQVLLDFGILGFIPFILLMFHLLTQAFHKLFQNPFEAYLLLWAVGALFQFRGPDAMLGFFIGAYFAARFDVAHEKKEYSNSLGNG